MMNFALTGAAGFVAPRHMQAVRDTGNRLVAAVDPHDSVGIMDRFFLDVSFFTEFERFDRHLEKLRRGPTEGRVHYVSVCAPNYLHDAHIRCALRVGADAICEKPLVLNPWNLDALAEIELETGHKVFSVLQLRLHPALLAARERLRGTIGKRHRVALRYVTSRGLWYQRSWKGSIDRSGGLASNIGIHFFDLLMWFFGAAQRFDVVASGSDRMEGTLELEHADVEWALSIRGEDLPRRAVEAGKTTFRSIDIDGEELEFSDGFADLHTRVYEDILAGGGFGIDDARPSIELVHRIRALASADRAFGRPKWLVE